ncbi:MAG: aminopeptidase P family N-terminal domain-containing protein, partial [Firmicutes bacterium]|nr:aminopeptidase P family N-terminal domain-containing protein [Bacillota bacterium]
MKERVEKLRKLLEENRLDGALITGLTAIRYYSGFTSDEAALVVTMKTASLLTDFRYTIQAREQSPDFDVVEVGRGALLPTVDRLLKEDGCRRVAFENHTMTVVTFEKYKALDYEFVPFSEEMNKPRLIKTADEIASLQRAQNLADEG